MIRLYIDWNVMSQMKSSKHSEFAEIISDDLKFLKFFSTSHISDIATSDQNGSNRENIEADLKFIEAITKGWCVYNSGTNVMFEKRVPLELYDERTELSDIQKIFQPGGLKKLVSELNLDPESEAKINPLLQTLEDLPTDEMFKEAFKDSQASDAMRQFLPELEGNYSLMGILNSFLSMFSRLNETEDYKHMRNSVQKGINLNRDRVFDAKDPYKLIDKAYQKFNISLPTSIDENKHAPKWYNELSNEYIRLDMHGYQEDKVSVGKGRKQTFRNTMEDAFHAAFATTCDFYITNDDKNFKKSEVVYEKLRINSLVMKPDEFVVHYNNWLSLEGKRSFLLITAILQHIEPVVSEDGNQHTYFGCFFIFDYFNKIHRIEDKALYLVLSREKPTNARMVFEIELSTLIDKLLDFLGEDTEKFGKFQPHEIALAREDKWPGRRWVYENAYYHLTLFNGHLQLYITGRERDRA